MKPDLEGLKLTERDIENLSGFDVNEIFIGGVFGGVYKPSIFQNTKRLAYFCLTEIFVFMLMFILTLPIGLLAIRNYPKSNDANLLNLHFLQITLGISLLMYVSWNLYMFIKVKRIKTLVSLLDEVDKYNEVIQAIIVFDKLEAVGIRSDLVNRSEVVETLNVTRDSLVYGLMTEKIIRDNRGLLARRYDLFDDIESNLIALRALEVNNQANEYGEFLNNALQIGMSVHQEMQKLSHPSRAEL